MWLCLPCTICKQYSLKYPISKIREIAGTDKEGTSALGVIKAAEELGFTAKGVKASKPEDLFSEIPLFEHLLIHIIDSIFSLALLSFVHIVLFKIYVLFVVLFWMAYFCVLFGWRNHFYFNKRRLFFYMLISKAIVKIPVWQAIS